MPGEVNLSAESCPQTSNKNNLGFGPQNDFLQKLLIIIQE